MCTISSTLTNIPADMNTLMPTAMLCVKHSTRYVCMLVVTCTMSALYWYAYKLLCFAVVPPTTAPSISRTSAPLQPFPSGRKFKDTKSIYVFKTPD